LHPTDRCSAGCFLLPLNELFFLCERRTPLFFLAIVRVERLLRRLGGNTSGIKSPHALVADESPILNFFSEQDLYHLAFRRIFVSYPHVALALTGTAKKQLARREVRHQMRTMPDYGRRRARAHLAKVNYSYLYQLLPDFLGALSRTDPCCEVVGETR
jgi:hypothetical protein